MASGLWDLRYKYFQDLGSRLYGFRAIGFEVGGFRGPTLGFTWSNIPRGSKYPIITDLGFG